MRTLRPAVLGLLIACGSSGLDARIDVKVLDLEPEEGPLSGGTPVTITGLGFDEGAVAWFDDTPLPTTRVDDLTLVITTPVWATAGPVDVKVTTSEATGLMDDGFTYTAGGGTGAGTGTGTATGTGTGTATGIAPTGLTGGIGQFVLTQVACMDCFPGWFDSDVDVWAEVAFHDGDPGSWLDGWPAPGTCVGNPLPSGITATTWDVGTGVDLVTPGRTVGLAQVVDADGPSYEAYGLSLGDFTHPALHDIVAPGGADLPAFTVPDAIETPEGLATLEPIEMLYVNQAAAFDARFSRTTGQDITWSPTGFDTVNVTLIVFSNDGQQTLGTIQCVDNDDGSLHVPAAELAVYPAASLLGVFVYRTQTRQAVIPVNGHTFEGVAQMGVFGTGIVSP